MITGLINEVEIRFKGVNSGRRLAPNGGDVEIVDVSVFTKEVREEIDHRLATWWVATKSLDIKELVVTTFRNPIEYILGDDGLAKPR